MRPFFPITLVSALHLGYQEDARSITTWARLTTASIDGASANTLRPLDDLVPRRQLRQVQPSEYVRCAILRFGKLFLESRIDQVQKARWLWL
jgi:hypothetical protein